MLDMEKDKQLIATLAAQTVGLIIWGATLNTTVNNLSDKILSIESWQNTKQQEISTINQKIVSMEVHVSNIREVLGEVRQSQRRIEDAILTVMPVGAGARN